MTIRVYDNQRRAASRLLNQMTRTPQPQPSPSQRMNDAGGSEDPQPEQDVFQSAPDSASHGGGNGAGMRGRYQTSMGHRVRLDPTLVQHLGLCRSCTQFINQKLRETITVPTWEIRLLLLFSMRRGRMPKMYIGVSILVPCDRSTGVSGWIHHNGRATTKCQTAVAMSSPISTVRSTLPAFGGFTRAGSHHHRSVPPRSQLFHAPLAHSTLISRERLQECMDEHG
jgi:hypothetical protein